VRHFAQQHYSGTVSHNGQLMIHNDSYASDRGAVRQEGRTILVAKFKLLYSEIALPRNTFAIRHIYIYIFAYIDRHSDFPEY